MELYRENSVLRLLNNNNINRKFEEQDRLTVPHFFFKHQVTRFPLKLTFRALSLFSDEGLTLDMSAFKPFTVANLRYHSVNNTKLPCYTFLPTQHHSFLRKLPPLFIYIFIACGWKVQLISSTIQSAWKFWKTKVLTVL